jgi:hypothetical protein
MQDNKWLTSSMLRTDGSFLPCQRRHQNAEKWRFKNVVIQA